MRVPSAPYGMFRPDSRTIVACRAAQPAVQTKQGFAMKNENEDERTSKHPLTRLWEILCGHEAPYLNTDELYGDDEPQGRRKRREPPRLESEHREREHC